MNKLICLTGGCHEIRSSPPHPPPTDFCNKIHFWNLVVITFFFILSEGRDELKYLVYSTLKSSIFENPLYFLSWNSEKQGEGKSVFNIALLKQIHYCFTEVIVAKYHFFWKFSITNTTAVDMFHLTDKAFFIQKRQLHWIALEIWGNSFFLCDRLWVKKKAAT